MELLIPELTAWIIPVTEPLLGMTGRVLPMELTLVLIGTAFSSLPFFRAVEYKFWKNYEEITNFGFLIPVCG